MTQVVKTKIEPLTTYKFGRTKTTQIRVIDKIRKSITDVAEKNAKGIAEALARAAQEEEPNVNAARLLWEYAGAKPSEKIEHTGGIGIVQLVQQLEHADTTPTQI